MEIINIILLFSILPFIFQLLKMSKKRTIISSFIIYFVIMSIAAFSGPTGTNVIALFGNILLVPISIVVSLVIIFIFDLFRKKFDKK